MGFFTKLFAKRVAPHIEKVRTSNSQTPSAVKKKLKLASDICRLVWAIQKATRARNPPPGMAN